MLRHKIVNKPVSISIINTTSANVGVFFAAKKVNRGESSPLIGCVHQGASQAINLSDRTSHRYSRAGIVGVSKTSTLMTPFLLVAAIVTQSPTVPVEKTQEPHRGDDRRENSTIVYTDGCRTNSTEPCFLLQSGNEVYCPSRKNNASTNPKHC